MWGEMLLKAATAATPSGLLVIAPEVGDVSIVDRSAFSRTVTVSGASLSTAISDPWGGSRPVISVPGSSYFNVPSSSDFVFSGDFTLEIWMWHTSGTGTNGRVMCYGGTFNPSKLNIYESTVYSSSYALQDNGLDYLYVPPTSTPTGQWNHILVRRSGTTLELGLNLSKVSTSSSATFGESGDQVNFGSYPDLSYSVVGYIGAVRFSNQYIADVDTIYSSPP